MYQSLILIYTTLGCLCLSVALNYICMYMHINIWVCVTDLSIYLKIWTVLFIYYIPMNIWWVHSYSSIILSPKHYENQSIRCWGTCVSVTQSKYSNFLSRNCNWKCWLFCLGLDGWLETIMRVACQISVGSSCPHHFCLSGGGTRLEYPFAGILCKTQNRILIG